MTVNNVNALLNFTAPQTGQTEQAAKQGTGAGDSFGQVMSKVNDTLTGLAGGSADDLVQTVRPAENADAAKPAKDVQAQETGQAQDTAGSSARAQDAAAQDGNRAVKDADGKAQTDAKQDGAAEEVEEAAKELVKQVADETDVTTEDVEAAMAALGLVPAELFDVDNLKKLLLAIEGSGDELTLVTDEKLYGSMQNLFAAAEDTLSGLQEKLGLTDEELDALLEQAAEEEQAEAAPEPVQTQPEDGAAAFDPAKEPEKSLEGMKDYTVTVQRDGETVQMKVTVNDESGGKSVQEEVTDAPKEEAQTGQRTREREASADSGRGEGGQTNGTGAFWQGMDRAEQLPETPAPVSAGYQSVQTQEIMDQILDYMKINLKADTQELQMQLHPASLGTVNVQIAAKDGAVTAQFTTQNETVRAVVETQLIQLKQQFEEQGIKVDAVEVTVAEHPYGEQFSQNHENADGQTRGSARGTRRINLDELDEEEGLEEMEESERIAVEMMQANGNTVDYTA